MTLELERVDAGFGAPQEEVSKVVRVRPTGLAAVAKQERRCQPSGSVFGYPELDVPPVAGDKVSPPDCSSAVMITGIIIPIALGSPRPSFDAAPP